MCSIVSVQYSNGTEVHAALHRVAPGGLNERESRSSRPMQIIKGGFCQVAPHRTIGLTDEGQLWGSAIFASDRYLTMVDKLLILLARLQGFEPRTCGLEVRCSIQLSYRRGSGLDGSVIKDKTKKVNGPGNRDGQSPVSRVGAKFREPLVPLSTSRRTTFVLSSSCPTTSARTFS